MLALRGGELTLFGIESMHMLQIDRNSPTKRQLESELKIY